MKTILKNKKISKIAISAILILSLNLSAYGVETFYKLPPDVMNLVFYHLREGNFNEVEDILKQEYYVNSNILFLVSLADFYIDTEQYPKAQSTLDRIKSVEPNNPELKALSSKLMYLTMQYDKANEYAKVTIQRHIKSSSAYLSMGNLNLDKAKKESNPVKKLAFLDEAQKDFYYAAQYNPKSSEPHVSMAKVYIAKGRDSNAYDELLIADEMGVYSPETQYFIAEYFYRIGNYDKAVYSLKKPILYNYGKSSKAHFMLGKIYEKLGDLNNAQKEYKLAAKLSPKNAEASASLKKLNAFMASSHELALSQKNDTVLNNAEKLLKGDIYLIQDKLASARNMYLQVLSNDPMNISAKGSLMELYYTQWGIGYFNPKNFFSDNQYFEKNVDDQRLQIPILKLKLISTPRMLPALKDRLNEMQDDTSSNYNALLNSVRASFLSGDYRMTVDKLNQLLTMNLSDAEKLDVAKALYLYRDYYDAQNVLYQIFTPPSEEIYTNLNEMIANKYKKAEEIQDAGNKLVKKKQYNSAILKYQECNRYFPTYSSVYIEMAKVYKKLKNYKSGIESIEKYQLLEELYPSTNSVDPMKVQKMLDSFKKKQEKQNKDTN